MNGSCPRCGTRVGPDARFCIACGQALAPASPPTGPAPTGIVVAPTSGAPGALVIPGTLASPALAAAGGLPSTVAVGALPVELARLLGVSPPLPEAFAAAEEATAPVAVARAPFVGVGLNAILDLGVGLLTGTAAGAPVPKLAAAGLAFLTGGLFRAKWAGVVGAIAALGFGVQQAVAAADLVAPLRDALEGRGGFPVVAAAAAPALTAVAGVVSSFRALLAGWRR